jgi:hypothetical protein
VLWTRISTFRKKIGLLHCLAVECEAMGQIGDEHKIKKAVRYVRNNIGIICQCNGAVPLSELFTCR